VLGQEDEQAAGLEDARSNGAAEPRGLAISTRILHPAHKSVEDPYFSMAPPLYQARHYPALPTCSLEILATRGLLSTLRRAAKSAANGCMRIFVLRAER